MHVLLHTFISFFIPYITLLSPNVSIILYSAPGTYIKYCLEDISFKLTHHILYDDTGFC